jgi:hypothetical protein
MQAADSKFEDVIDRLDQVISLLERIAEAVERSETDISAARDDSGTIKLDLIELGTNVHSIKVDAEALPDIRHEVGMIEINTR